MAVMERLKTARRTPPARPAVMMMGCVIRARFKLFVLLFCFVLGHLFHTFFQEETHGRLIGLFSCVSKS